MKIWGRINSTNVRKALWAVEEAGVAYDHEPAGGAFGIVDSPAFRAMNPNGLVPVLEDDGLVLWESNAVVRYLAARYAPGTLYPYDPATRAVGDKWMDWAVTTIAPALRPLFWGLLRTPPAERDLAAIDAARLQMAKLLAMPDAALQDAPYLSGESFAMGDIPLGCVAYAWFELPIDRPDLPHLAAWYERLKTRPAFVKAVMTPLT